MLWCEKIDLIKRGYSDDEFTVPFPNRKNILRNIESHYIKRSEEYFHPNSYRGAFKNWWEGFRTDQEYTIGTSWVDALEKRLNYHDQYWLACEFPSGEVYIYKSKLQPMIDLIRIGTTWSRISFAFTLKMEWGIAIKREKAISTFKVHSPNIEIG